MLPNKTSDCCCFPVHLIVRLNTEARLCTEDNKWYIDLATLLVYKIGNRFITIDRVKNSVDTASVLDYFFFVGGNTFWLINLILKFLPLSPVWVFSCHSTEWSNHPAASRGQLKPGLDPPCCFPQPKWPGPVARVRGRTAGRQDGRTAGAAPGAQEDLSSWAVPTDPAAAAPAGSSGPIWRSVSPGFYSPTRIFTAHNHWLFLRAPGVCRTAVCCVIRFLPSLLPATAQPREPRSPQPRKEGSH